MQIGACSPPPPHPTQKVVVTHVHVHPDAVLFTDVRNGDERVKGSVHRCSGCRTDEERYETLQWHKHIMLDEQAAADTMMLVC